MPPDPLNRKPTRPALEEPLKHSVPKRELPSVPLKPVVPTVSSVLQITSSCSGQKTHMSFETLLPHTPDWIFQQDLLTKSLKYIQKRFLTTSPVIILVQITFVSYLEGYNCLLTASCFSLCVLTLSPHNNQSNGPFKP